MIWLITKFYRNTFEIIIIIFFNSIGIIFPQSSSHTTHSLLAPAKSTKRFSDWLGHEKIFFIHLQSITVLSLCLHPPKWQCLFFSAGIQNTTNKNRQNISSDGGFSWDTERLMVQTHRPICKHAMLLDCTATQWVNNVTRKKVPGSHIIFWIMEDAQKCGT